jgi:MoxR-like ATPase
MFSRLSLIFVCAGILLCTAVFAEYTVVMKDTGKVIKGEFVQENDQILVITKDHVSLTFKKALLDLEKMKTLNEAVKPEPKPTDARTIQINNTPAVPVEEDHKESVVDVARKNNEQRTGNAVKFSEGDKPESTLSPEKKEELIRKYKGQVEQLEADVKALKEKGSAEEIIKDRQTQIDDLQKKIKLLSGEKLN